MANLSIYGSNVLSEVPYSDTYQHDVINQSVPEMSYFEQTHIADYPDNEITSDSNIIPYSQYLQESQHAVVQDTNSSAQQDLMMISMFEQMSNQERVKTFEQRINVDLNSREKLIDSQMDDMIRDRNALKQEIDSLKQTLSKHVKEKESLLQTFTIFKKESKEKERKNMDKEINLEKTIKELDNIVYKVGQFAQIVHMLTKPHVFYDDTHKQALGYQNPFYLKKAQQIKPTLYDGSVLYKKHDVIYVVDEEETLILEEESRSKMLAKQNDSISKEKKINISLISYSELKKLAEDFGKRFVPQQELVVKQRTTPDAITEGSWDIVFTVVNLNVVIGDSEMKDKSFVEIYNECLELEAKLVKNNDLHKEREHLKKTYKELYDSIKKTHVQTKDQCDSLIAQLNQKFVENPNLNAQIQENVFAVTSLKNELRKLKGKNVLENATPMPNHNVIAPGMFKLDLEPLAPKVLKNRDAHIDYIRRSREHADILREIVENARALSPLDSNLDDACKKLGMKSSTSASRSQPSCNTKNNRISRTTGINMMNKVEDQPRSVKSSSNKKNLNIEPVCNANVKHTMLKANSELICVKCNQCIFDANHDLCVLAFVNDVNVRSKSKFAKCSKKKNIWKPTGKVLTDIGYRWKPTGRTFTIDGNKCLLTRITSTKVVPLKETT
ncbi:hypothetical protein Tco_0784534 [Tanacetum coccineum]